MSFITKISRFNFEKFGKLKVNLHHSLNRNGSNLMKMWNGVTQEKAKQGAVTVGKLVGISVGVTLFSKRYLVSIAHCQSFADLDNPLDLTTLELELEDVGQKKTVSKPQEPPFNFEKFFSEYVLPETLGLVLAIIWAVVGAGINMKIPLELGKLINKLSSGEESAEAKNYVSQMRGPLNNLIGMYALQAFTSFAYISLLSNVGERIAARLRRNLFQSYLYQDVSFFEQHKTGELIDRLTTDVQDFKSSFKACISQGIKSTTQMTGCIIALYVTSPKMTVMLCTALPVMMFIGTSLGSGLRNISKSAQHMAAMATGRANEVLANFTTVRSFANEDFEVDEYGKLVERSCHLNQRLGVGIGLFQGLSNLSLNGVVLSVIYVGGYLVSVNEINAGQLMAFLVSAQMIQKSMTSLSMLFGSGVRGMSAGYRVFEYLHMQPRVDIHAGKILSDKELTGKISFRNVTFTYPLRPRQPVLKNIDLEIRPNTTLALVGPSGGGKSTIASLVERFYDVRRGSIKLDGYDIRKLNPSWLRGKVLGFISQEPVLFSGTIRDNIRYGKLDASDEEVVAAARMSNAHEFIKKFPKGYDTKVGERGASLSGGQKQRIAIARALLRNPTVLILDEATSALDASSEQLVQQALNRVMKGRTVIVIAHRLSTIKNAEQIVLIKQGKIFERGTHEQLKRLGGLYHGLVTLQQR